MKMLSGEGLINIPEIGLDIICRAQTFSDFGYLRPKYACGRYQKSIELFSYRLLYDNIADLSNYVINLIKLKSLNFYEIDKDKFNAIDLAKFSLREGGLIPAVFNYTNELMVDLFLRQRESNSNPTLTTPTLDDIAASVLAPSPKRRPVPAPRPRHTFNKHKSAPETITPADVEDGGERIVSIVLPGN